MIRFHTDYERYEGWPKFSIYIRFFSGTSYFSGLGSPFGDIRFTDSKSSIAFTYIADFNTNIDFCFIFLCLNFNIIITLLFVLIMLVACHLQKLSFVVVYLLEDEYELSLGMLIRLKRIYNFCLLHALFMTLLHVLLELSYLFQHIWD